MPIARHVLSCAEDTCGFRNAILRQMPAWSIIGGRVYSTYFLSRTKTAGGTAARGTLSRYASAATM